MKRLLAKLGIVDQFSFWAFVRQFVKFSIVGLSNTFIMLCAYYLFIAFGMHYLPANIIAFFLSIGNAFYWNSKYVFPKTYQGNAKPFVKLTVSYGSTLLLSTVLLIIMVDKISISAWLAPLINLLFTIPINFLLNKFWAFR